MERVESGTLPASFMDKGFRRWQPYCQRSKSGLIGGKMTLTFDKQSYRSLLSDTLPQVIETEEEYDPAIPNSENGPLRCCPALG
jgi:hypothetical protein